MEHSSHHLLGPETEQLPDMEAARAVVKQYQQDQLDAVVLNPEARAAQQASLNHDLRRALGKDFDLFGSEVEITFSRRRHPAQLRNPDIATDGRIVVDAQLCGSSSGVSVARYDILRVGPLSETHD